MNVDERVTSTSLIILFSYLLTVERIKNNKLLYNILEILEHGESQVRIPSGAQIFFCVLLWLILYISLNFLYNINLYRDGVNFKEFVSEIGILRVNSAKVLNIRTATWQMEEKQNVSYLKRAKKKSGSRFDASEIRKVNTEERKWVLELTEKCVTL